MCDRTEVRQPSDRAAGYEETPRKGRILTNVLHTEPTGDVHNCHHGGDHGDARKGLPYEDQLH
ncbi:hypothetical protein [Actinoplanes sp. SE50/110]|uniref:hypothetical protein n=1 Tax=Actinoplanes sp. (strain ATCC 31044 / CBS 674.73 / SE50/110) TaxID=134676 RepID=UPI0012F9FFA6|nr:hypothetical protein [Actinoplanes sp. SE50/110]